MNTINLWANYFIDDDWGVVGLAVAKHVAVSRWPPSIAEIRAIMAEIQCPDLIPPDEAWAAVARYIDAAGGSGGWERPEMYFTPQIIHAVNTIGYRNLRDLRKRRYASNGFHSGADREAFMLAYRPVYERGRDCAQVPPHLRHALCYTQAANSRGGRALLKSTNSYLAKREGEGRDIFRRLTDPADF